ncbi:hypothetical protein ID855_07445 [Xenorhabdus sp. ZM]|uniref:YniB family protein n=1 Tax=Xenorhabdus szentirmaii TaxID=290112 RepID=UPI0019BA0930|nr:YniB family protein [Xenorhabdus sp. ZM]MBD2804532.1 hypothetical protein [Xenorhabdus sp. ZM]
MIYQQVGYFSIVKRMLGWLIFVPAFLSTFASVINLAWQQGIQGDGIHAIFNDFIKMMVEMVKFNTPFLDFFWKYSPVPSSTAGILGFIVIYLLIFVGLAMSASGLRMYRQYKYIKENIEDQLILENAKESGVTKEQLESKIQFPRHSLFSQVFTLYISPIIIGILAYLLSKLLGW